MASKPFSVAGKTAIVTGAGSGINYCFAKLLLENDCNVIIADLSLRPEAEYLTSKYTSKPSCIFVRTNVTNWDDLARMFDVADEKFGGVDVVCPGAGIYEPHWSNFWKPPGTTDSKDPVHGRDGVGSYATLDINVTHPIRTTQLAISRWLNADPKVSSSNPKRVVHISSIAGQVPGFSTPMYIASKHAMNGFIRSMAPLEERLGIRVNGVAPGVIKTPLWTDHPEKLKTIDEVKDVWIAPEEVAEAMLKCVTAASDPKSAMARNPTVGDVRALNVSKTTGTDGSEKVVSEEGWGAGDVMEVTKGKTRVVGWKMDPGPSGTGITVTNRQTLMDEVFGWLGEDGWGVANG